MLNLVQHPSPDFENRAGPATGPAPSSGWRQS